MEVDISAILTGNKEEILNQAKLLFELINTKVNQNNDLLLAETEYTAKLASGLIGRLRIKSE